MASDDYETPSYMRVPNQIAADFCSLVKICQKRVTFDPSTADHEEEGTTRAQKDNKDRKALLERLHSNWPASRDSSDKEQPMIEFLTIAKWFAKHQPSVHHANKGRRSSKSTAHAECPEFPSSEPVTLLSQIIQLQNERLNEWIRQRKERNHVYLAVRPDPEAEDDDTLQNKARYYNYRSWHQDFPKPERFNPKRIPTACDPSELKTRSPDGRLSLKFDGQVPFIESLNRQLLFLEDYEKNKYPEEWRELFQEEGSGSHAKYWEYWREKDEIWEQKEADEELKQGRLDYEYRDGYATGYINRRNHLRVMMLGYPEHLLSDEEKAERDANVFRKVWTSVPTWPEQIRASLPEGFMKRGGEKEK
ncbi:hypothetical protein V8F33_006814 [Rhypophila sp. PSN 637]